MHLKATSTFNNDKVTGIGHASCWKKKTYNIRKIYEVIVSEIEQWAGQDFNPWKKRNIGCEIHDHSKITPAF